MDLKKGSPMSTLITNCLPLDGWGHDDAPWQNGPVGPPINKSKKREKLPCTPHLRSSQDLQHQKALKSQGSKQCVYITIQ